MQVWRSELTLTLEGAEARSWWRQGGAGGPGRPRPRPDPSHIPSSSPPLTILTSVLAACADQRTCCSLCDGGGLGTVAHLRVGATGLPFAAARLHSRRKFCMFLLVGVCILARSEISKSSVRAKYGAIGKPSRGCRPHDSIRSGGGGARSDSCRSGFLFRFAYMWCGASAGLFIRHFRLARIGIRIKVIGLGLAFRVGRGRSCC